MPARDTYHNAVIQALVKDGWTITDDQYGLSIGDRRLWIDLRATKEEQRLVCLIEIKIFESRSQVEDLAEALGKYLLYRVVLTANNNPDPLYLAVPEPAWNGFSAKNWENALSSSLALKYWCSM